MDITGFSMDYFSLKGKTAIVTGGNSGLGRAFSLALAKAGANLFIPSLTADDGTTRQLIENEGARMEFLQVDITNEGTPKLIIEKCLEHFGTVDILVNSAGMNKIAAFKEFDRGKWDPMLQVNLTAAFEVSHEAAKWMMERREGKIINICSMFSYLGGLGSPAYAASKHGLAGLTKSFADELGSYNIQVNGIAPGYYATELTKETRNDPVANEKILNHTPANRWGDPVDLMGAVVFLASRAADYVNGHILAVDGGYLVR
ncbi:SDR family oxidoreductase [Virgibacillus sp. YIM 98842]|mgnify:CR=1 FL=1|jgi:NAD(P)-dependent dehydrogenase (short-subunit alcohol dehydrogenase family)|uniref:SDR family NAD(P)-dependent oxidoreductase n=1 Tax=Virgibacillus sp. YIM 98842 TaxID=2663533 RepID=UPI0013DA4EAC|nr:SDR family oxidoreductase [Virgibacillus sp. YIM 98842]